MLKETTHIDTAVRPHRHRFRKLDPDRVYDNLSAWNYGLSSMIQPVQTYVGTQHNDTKTILAKKRQTLV